MDATTIDKVLPQTQCEECGFKGCRPYAEAIAKGEADINLCPPGGVEVLNQLAALVGKDASAYVAQVAANTRPPAVAKIREEECIGCTKCIQACPVDAIIGTNKMMHTVFSAECTGCRLCVEPCPVDCIEIIELEQPQFSKEQARVRFQARNQRLVHKAQKKRSHYRSNKTLNPEGNDKKAKQAYILEALKRKMKGHE